MKQRGPRRAVHQPTDLPAATSAQQAIRQLTEVAIEVVAWRLWRYRVPVSERERLARLGSLREACAALELRLADGRANAARFAELSEIDDAVDSKLHLLARRSAHAEKCVERVRAFRTAQWALLERAPGITAERRAEIASRLGEVYARHLDLMLHA